MIILVGCLVGACIAGGLAINGPALSREHERRDAEHRWSQRPFGAYRLVLEDFRCVYDIEVQGQKIVDSAPRADCIREARSIDDLFVLLQRDGSTGTRCITQGCACDDRLSVQGSYDPVLGYPREIEVRISAQPNWQHADYWRYMATHLRPPTCEFPVGRKFIRVLKLQAGL
jgi:hypothetical protein